MTSSQRPTPGADLDALLARVDATVAASAATLERIRQADRDRGGDYWLAKGLAEKAGMDYDQLRRDHRATWHVVVGGERLDVQISKIRGGGWGFDVTCRCGWESRTGGATRTSVKRDHIEHVADVVLDVLVPK